MPRLNPKVIAQGTDPYAVLNVSNLFWQRVPHEDGEPFPINLTLKKKGASYSLYVVDPEISVSTGAHLRYELVQVARQCRLDWEEVLIDLKLKGKRHLRSTVNLSSEPGLIDVIQQQALPRLARQGKAMRNLLFYDTVKDFGLREFADQYIVLGDSPRRKLSVMSDELFLPWDLAYLGDATQPAFDEFLGSAFSVQELAPSNPTEAQELSGSTNGFVLVAAAPADFSKKIASEHAELCALIGTFEGCTLVKASTSQELLKIFSEFDFHSIAFAYIFAHGREGHRIELGGEQVRREDLIALMKGCASGRGPLVFINGCNSSADGGREFRGFGRILVENGASGVIGAQSAIPTIFAVHFAQRLIELLLNEGVTVGEAISRARDVMLRDFGNPLGLLYSVYNGRDLKLKDLTISGDNSQN
jgi:hypothetical protein